MMTDDVQADLALVVRLVGWTVIALALWWLL
jgi:hypothetical protein